MYTDKQIKIDKLNKIFRLIELVEKGLDESNINRIEYGIRTIAVDAEDCFKIYEFLVQEFNDTATDLCEFFAERFKED